jgi:multiple sugar transport system permease protein
MTTIAQSDHLPQKRKALSSYQIAKRRRNLLYSAAITLLALMILSLYIMPLVFGVVTSLKTQSQASAPNSPIIPSDIVQYEYAGKNYDVYEVPTNDGIQEWALIERRRRGPSLFIDIDDPNQTPIEWEGNTFQLDPAYELSIEWGNYPDAWNTIKFPRLLFNTMVYASITMLGTLVASSLVAYGFARYRFPFRNLLFMILMSTIILPPAVTLVPTYAFFIRVLDWGGTWYPLIVPQMFGNAYNIFLLRQYFLTIPREMEEAAQVDGAGPFRIFISVILPQSVPALTAVALFHFFFAWNDFFGPLIYLAGNRDANPITVGLTEFNGLYSAQTELILAASVISMVLPLTIFFMAQRVFIQGIVITGVDK